MSSIMIIIDIQSYGVTYDHHSDDSRGIIYDQNMFIVQAKGLEYTELNNSILKRDNLKVFKVIVRVHSTPTLIVISLVNTSPVTYP